MSAATAQTATRAARAPQVWASRNAGRAVAAAMAVTRDATPAPIPGVPAKEAARRACTTGTPSMAGTSAAVRTPGAAHPPAAAAVAAAPDAAESATATAVAGTT